jgi:hypothetical protein
MTTLAPGRVGPEAGRRAPEPSSTQGRSASPPKDDSGTRAWLRRKAVAAWMNILIAGTVAVTVVTAGITFGHPWPEPGT